MHRIKCNCEEKLVALLDVLRREEKYRMSTIAAMQLYGYLRLFLPEDPHNDGSNGYLVRSLYFDDVDDSDYFDKIDGLERRKKLRLRIYSPDDRIAKLEIKEKVGANQRKRSIEISRQDARRMIEGEYSFLMQTDQSLAHELYATLTEGAYTPKCVVEYRRAAFIVPTNDTRVTLDMDLRWSESGFDIFSAALNSNPVGPFDDVTLEVKYNHFLLSYVKDMLDNCQKSPVAYSKYCIARCAGHL